MYHFIIKNGPQILFLRWFGAGSLGIINVIIDVSRIGRYIRTFLLNVPPSSMCARAATPLLQGRRASSAVGGQR